MTSKQKESLSRVRASWACYGSLEAKAGSYNTEDMKVVLLLLGDQIEMLSCVEADLKTLRENLAQDNNNFPFTAMVDSTLALLECEERIL